MADTVVWMAYDLENDHLYGWCNRCHCYVDNGEATYCPVCGAYFERMVAEMAHGK